MLNLYFEGNNLQPFKYSSMRNGIFSKYLVNTLKVSIT